MKHARIEVRNKKGVFDAVAEHLLRDIRDIGVKGIKGVECIDAYSVSGNLSAEEVNRIAGVLLADKVVQEFDVKKGFKFNSKDVHVVEIAYNPGVMDPVEESAMKAIRDLGIKGVGAVKTSRSSSESGGSSGGAVSWGTAW